MAVRRNGIALVGFMGAGKTTVGLALAQRLGWPFIDLDARLASRYGPIALQVRAHGLAAFRAREKQEALALCEEAVELAEQDALGAARVLATGGGTVLDPEIRAALARHHVLVFLDVPLAVATARVGSDPGRPLWDADIARRYEERQAIYRQADLHLDATLPVHELVEQIVEGRCQPDVE